MELPPKHCPECRAEYVHAATRCADCDVSLVLEAELGSRPSRELPPIAELVLVRAATWGWIERLATRLAEEGIDCRVEPMQGQGRQPRSTSGPTCGCFVRPEDAERAAVVDAHFVRSEIPDLPDEAAEVEPGSCPACGASNDPDAAECADCGLAFAPAEE
jgi:hypothetical protein